MDIIEDLKAIFPIKEQISVFLSEINKKDKISDNGIKEAANSISLDEEKARIILKMFLFLVNVASTTACPLETIKKIKTDLLGASSENLTDEVVVFDIIYEQILKNEQLVKNIKRSLNAEMPNAVSSVRIICDSRPIFSFDKLSIIDVQYIGQLFIERSEEGQNELFECDEEQIKELQDQCALALDKIKKMKAFQGKTHA